MLDRKKKLLGKGEQRRVKAGNQPKPQEALDPTARMEPLPPDGTYMVKDSSIT